MSVTLWNAIITVGISITSLMIASATCTVLHVRARVIKPRMYGVHALASNVESSWPGFEMKSERDGRETCRKQARMHQQTSSGRQTSQ